MMIEVRRVDLRYQLKNAGGGYSPEAVVVLWFHEQDAETTYVAEVKPLDSLHLFTDEDGTIKVGRITK